MATLFNTKISATYPSLIKTIDNAALTATLKQLTDGTGGLSGLYANTAGDFKVTSILEWGSLKDTGTGVTITQFVTAANGIANFNNDTTVPTSAAVKTYVDAVVTASDLDFLGDTNTGTPAVDLDSQNFSVLGTTNEIVTSGANQTLTIGLPNSVTISGTFTGTTFAGDLNGTINTDTRATTQSAGDNSTKVATTEYVDSLDAASDLDFSGDSGTGDVTLNTQVLAITGTTNQIVTAAANQGLSLSLPATVHRDLQGNVTGNVDGDLTGNVTATSVLADGVSATTQASSDSSVKVATTAFVKGLNNASDLDFTTDSGSGAVVLNTETFSVLGTTNQINSAGSGQAVTLSLPATVHRNLLGNVTGDLTGNADTATKWETARDLSLTGQATGTISSVDGTLNVSGAVTLDNNSVTGKVLTGLPTPAASTVLPTDSILEGIGKIQSQINGLANGLQFQGSWNADTNSPNLISGGGEVDSGTTTSAATNKLIQTGQNFTTTVNVNDKVINQVDFQTAIVTNVDSDTTLSLDTDIMLSGEAYTIDTSPFITQGFYYVVNVGGATNLNGISEWSVGDWVIAGADNLWTKLDHTDVEGVGTPGNIAKWLSTGTIADSIIAESGAAITVTGTLATTSSLTSGSNFDVATDKFTANATTGNVAFLGNLAINTDVFTINATSGNVEINGTTGNLDILGNFTLNTDKFTIAASTGNTSVGGTLESIGNFEVGTDKFTVNATSGNIAAAGTVTSPTFLGDLTGTVNATSDLADGVTATTQSANDASTKVATTAYVDTSAGLYLPLVGGTLTGALTGTSATFAGNVNVGGTVTSPAGVGTIMGVVGRNGVGGGTAGIVLKDYDNDGWDIWNSGGGLNFRYNNDASVGFGITSTGATTFAGNVTVATNITTTAGFLQLGAVALPSAGVAAITNRSGSNNLYIQTSSGNTVLLVDGAQNTMYSAGSTEHSFLISNVPKLTIDSSGIVKINTTAVNARFRVDEGGEGEWVAGFKHTGTNPYGLFIDTSVNTSTGYTLGCYTNTGTGLFLKNDGKLGIGTDDPAGKLEVNGGVGVATTGGTLIVRQDGDTGDDGIALTSSFATSHRIWKNAAGDLNIGNAGNLSALVQLMNGNIGIGTDSPLQKLHLEEAGATSVYAEWSNNSRANNAYMGLTVAGQLIIQNNTSIKFDTGASYTERMRITSGGDIKVNFNQSGSNGNLYFQDVDNGASMLYIQPAQYVGTAPYNTNYINAANNSNIGFIAGGSERMHITSGGYVHAGFTAASNTYHQFAQYETNDQWTTLFKNNQASPYGVFVKYENATPNNGASAFFYAADSTTTRFEVRSNGGVANFSGNNVNLSDERTKKEIVDAPNSLNSLCELKVRHFKYKDQTDEKIHTGLIAQEVEKIDESLVDNSGFGESDYKAIYNTDLQFKMLKAIQELKAEVDKLKQECKCKN